MNLLCRIKNWLKINRESAWKLGILENGFEDLKAGKIHFVKNGAFEGKKWFADPFILSYDQLHIVALVEEYDYTVNRGRLAKVVIDRTTWTIIDCSVVLDLPTHLSFPVIYRREGKIYICPENNCGNTFDLYEFDEKSNSLKKIRQICKSRLTDAIIYNFSGKYYLFSTCEPTPNGKCLSIFQSDFFEGPFQKFEDILFNENVARNAGMFFSYNGNIIRPAQESNYSYGHGLVFQKIELKDGHFVFTEINRFLSFHPIFKNGIHTYNEYEGMGIVDFKGHRNFAVGSFYQYIHTILVKLGVKKETLLK